MFPTRYFPDRYFAPRYWPKIGATSTAVPRVTYYPARRDTTFSLLAKNETTMALSARRDTTFRYSGSES